MSMYSTGEIAKLCGVSVRTVQYYDARNILVPSELSEGGRRLYSEDDLKRMKIICFLREAGFSIKSISELLAEEHPEKLIAVLLEEHEQELRDSFEQHKQQLEMIESMKRELKEIKNFSVESLGDIAYVMKQNNKRRNMLIKMLLFGIPVAALEIAAIVLWITRGMWWLFAIWCVVGVVFGVVASRYYYRHTAYICPECHEVFRPSFKEVFFAYHTPKMRRLTCPQCKHKGLCLEVYAETDEHGDLKE